MNMVTKTSKDENRKEISIAPINLATANFKIKGMTPLLMDKMPQDTLQAILDKQSGVGKTGKKVRDIENEIKQAIHRLPDGSVGFPAAGFLSGMIESTSFVGDKFFSKKLIRGLKIINGVNGLIQIKYKKQDILQHNIESNSKMTPQFHDWECDLTIQFDRNNVSEKDIAILINYAGFYYGIGIWSPRCKSGGSFGMYALKTTK